MAGWANMPWLPLVFVGVAVNTPEDAIGAASHVCVFYQCHVLCPTECDAHVGSKCRQGLQQVGR